MKRPAHRTRHWLHYGAIIRANGLCVLMLFVVAPSVVVAGKKYDLELKVTSSSVRSYTAGTIPAQTTCTSTLNGGELKTDCATTPAENINNYAVFLDASLNGVRTDIRCSATWAGSSCASLSPGTYQARWLNKKQTRIRVSVLEHGKSREITFDVSR